jgi:hypothetical protein
MTFYHYRLADEPDLTMLLYSWTKEIARQFPIPYGLQSITIWNTDRKDCPSIKNYAGLTHWDGRIELAHNYANKATLAHELGHWAAMGNKIHTDGDFAGRAVWELYLSKRGNHTTQYTNIEERWAEDFKAFYGPGIDPNDDCYKTEFTGKIPPATEVIGLREYFAGLPYVLKHIRANPNIRDLTHTTFYKWFKPSFLWFGQWEAWHENKFWRWDGSKWLMI